MTLLELYITVSRFLDQYERVRSFEACPFLLYIALLLPA